MSITIERLLSSNVTAVIIVLIIILLVFAIPGFIAKSKGRSFVGFLIFGLFLWPIALIVALCMKNEKKEREIAYKINAPDMLISYKKLLDDGVITQKEFNQKKNEIFNKKF